MVRIAGTKVAKKKYPVGTPEQAKGSLGAAARYKSKIEQVLLKNKARLMNRGKIK